MKKIILSIFLAVILSTFAFARGKVDNQPVLEALSVSDSSSADTSSILIITGLWHEPGNRNLVWSFRENFGFANAIYETDSGVFGTWKLDGDKITLRITGEGTGTEADYTIVIRYEIKDLNNIVLEYPDKTVELRRWQEQIQNTETVKGKSGRYNYTVLKTYPEEGSEDIKLLAYNNYKIDFYESNLIIIEFTGMSRGLSHNVEIIKTENDELYIKVKDITPSDRMVSPALGPYHYSIPVRKDFWNGSVIKIE